MNRSTLVMLALLVLAGIAGLVWQRSGARPSTRPGLQESVGVVAADRIVVASRVPGVVQEIVVKSGDVLVRGQVVARLEDPLNTGRVAQARQELAAIEARLRSEQASLAVQQARVPAAIRAAEASVELAHAQLQQQEALEEQQWQELERLRAIAEPDDETRARLAEAELAYERAQQDVVVAHAAVERAESDLELVRLGRDEIVAHIAEVDALTADRERAEGAVREAAVGIKDLEVTAPLGGTVLDVRAAPGDQAAQGTPIAELRDMERLYVVAEIGELARGQVRPGRRVRVRLESGEVGGIVSAIVPEGAKIECDDPRVLVWGVRVRVLWDSEGNRK
jgi:multidrug resistance efflux pump